MDTELNKETVPDYLKKSDLYQNFDFTEDDSAFKIPNKYFKENSLVFSIEDLKNLLHVIKFWLIVDTPHEIFDFILANKDINLSKIYEEFSDSFSNLQAIEEIKILSGEYNNELSRLYKKNEPSQYIIESYPGCMINYVIYKGYFNLLKYLHKKNYLWNPCVSYWAMKASNYEIFKYLLENKCYLHEGCFKLACETKDIRFLSYLLENHKNRFPKSFLQIGYHLKEYIYPIKEYSYIQFAGTSRLLENLKLLRKHNFSWHLEISNQLALIGEFKCLKFALDDGCPTDEETCHFAVYGGNLKCLKYLHENGCPWDKEIIKLAAHHNNFDCLKYAHENGCQLSGRVYELALYNKNFEMFKYATENNFPNEDDSSIYYTNNIENLVNGTNNILNLGNFKFAKYLIERDYKYSPINLWNCCYLAHEENNKDFLDYALPLCSKSSSISEECSKNGLLNLLEFLVKNGCKIDEKTFKGAAYNSQINCLRYLHQINCPWNIDVYNTAIERKNVNNLKYLHENGYPWDESCVSTAIEHSSDYCLSYLLINKCPALDPIGCAIKMDNSVSLEILHENGYKFDIEISDMICLFVREKKNKCLKYLLENNLPDDKFGEDLIKIAIEVRNHDTLSILSSVGYKLNEREEFLLEKYKCCLRYKKSFYEGNFYL